VVPIPASSPAPKSGRTHLGPSKPFPSPSDAQGTGPSERAIPQSGKIPGLSHRGPVQAIPTSSETELSPALLITVKANNNATCGQLATLTFYCSNHCIPPRPPRLCVEFSAPFILNPFIRTQGTGPSERLIVRDGKIPGLAHRRLV
jgi:hypothetical protein